MKFQIMFAVAISAVFAFGQVPQPPGPVTNVFEQMEMIRKQGTGKDGRSMRGRRPRFDSRAGMLTKVSRGEAVSVLDFRSEPTDINPILEKMGTFTSSALVHKPMTKSGCSIKAAFEAKKDGARAVIAIGEDGENVPALAVFPEDHVGVINFSRLKDADAAKSGERLEKELWRALAFAMGGYAQDYPCAMKAIDSLESLDKECITMTCPPVNFKVADTSRKLGIATVSKVPYAIAVKEGWAPAPTNEVQRAVWDSVKNGTPSAGANGGAMTNIPAK